jgi:acetoin utilization deacetylase AcuC-like enzyme
MSSLAYLTHPDCLRHEMGAHHPECPDRVTAIHERLLATGLLDRMDVIDPPLATDEQILRAHSTDHRHALEAASPASGRVRLDADTSINPWSLQAARRAAGAAVRATERVVAGTVRRAFCNIRPPGHHATRDAAMGFCLFNNAVIGLRHALAEGGLERVALIDFDVHHGNGSEDIVAGDERVLMVSTFQRRLYPFSGEVPLDPRFRNVGLEAHSDGAALRRALEDDWAPALRQFKPQMLFISAGFDAHRADGLAQLAWTEDDYHWVTARLVSLADELCEGRIVSVLEGGYDLPALARSAEQHVRALMDL